jgi:fibronectin-binding autotransporter adhesin
MGAARQVMPQGGQPGVTVEPTKGNYTSTAPTGWSGSNTGDQAFTLQATPAFQQVAYLNSGPGGTLSQTFTTSANTGSGYEFAVLLNIGNRIDTGTTPSGTVTVTLSAGGVEIGEGIFTAGAVGTSQQLSFVTGNIDPVSLSNQNITLSIGNGVNAQTVVGDAIVEAVSNLLIDGNFADVNLASGASGVTTEPTKGNYTSTPAAGWSGSDTGAQDFTPAASTFFANQVAEYVNSGTLSQTFTAPNIASGPNVLMVSLDVGTRLDEAPTTGSVTVAAAVNGTTIGQATFNAASVAAGGGALLQFTTEDLDALGDGGKQVTLTITNDATHQIIVGNVSVVPALNFDVASGQTATDTTAITGPGIVLTGGGTLVLNNGGNSYSGGTIIEQGKLSIAAAGDIGTGTLTLGNGTTIDGPHGRIDRRYRHAQLHADISSFGPQVAARKSAQITTILAMTSPAKGSTAARIVSPIAASSGGARSRVARHPARACALVSASAIARSRDPFVSSGAISAQLNAR